MKTIPFILSVGLGCSVWLASMAGGYGANWPGFRGSAAGAAEGGKPPIQFNQGTNVLWKADLARGHSSPVIWQDSIFITSADNKKLITTCLDRLTGKKRWEQSVTVENLEPVHGANSNATSTPVTDGQSVFVYFGSFGLLAYDFQGKELWRKPLPVPKTFFNQGTGTSPILAENKLIQFVQVGNKSQLLALDPKDGKEIWNAPMPFFNNSYATPVYWKENGQGYVGMVCAHRFTAFAMADGKEAWWVGSLSFQACATPIVAGDRLIISVAGGQGEPSNFIPPPPFEEYVKKYDANHDGLISAEEIPDSVLFTDRHNSNGQGDTLLRNAFSWFAGWNSNEKINAAKWEDLRSQLDRFSKSSGNHTILVSVRTGGKKDVTQSHVVWKESKGVPEVSSPLLWQGKLYQIRSGGLLVCRDAETGKLIYENKTESRGGYFASPVAADGRLYVASDRGDVTVIQAGEAFKVLARNELGDPIIASPAVVENTLYIRTSKQLMAFGVKPE